jgi:transketolase
MSMREQFVKTVEALLATDQRLLVLLGDIGVRGFRNAFKLFPGRIYNIGIIEQSTVSLASGLSMEGFIPLVHTIAPFLVKRVTEQLKNDFCYQGLGGNFVSVGASYDYAALGRTHHCPADVGILKNLPGMEIVLPGTAKEFDLLFRASYSDNKPTYFCLSEWENPQSFASGFVKAEVVKKEGWLRWWR